MDVSSVKAKATIDATASSKPKSTAEQLMSDFSTAVAERMKKSGQGLSERSQNSVVNKLNTKPHIAQDTKPDPKPEQKVQRDDPQPRERAEAPQKPQDERDRTVDAKDSAPRENPHTDTEQTETATDDHAGDAPKQEQSSANDGQKADDDAPQKQAQDGENGENSDVADAATETAVDGSVENQAETVLATVTEVVTQSASSEAAGVQQQTVKSAGKVDTTMKPGQQAALNAAESGEEAPDVMTNGEGTNKKANADAASQQTQANLAQKGVNNHASGQDQSLKQQQAAEMSAKLGGDQKVDVKVNVTKQSEQLVSQPSANLTAQAATKVEGDVATQTAAQTAAKGPVQGQQMASTHNLGNQAGQPGQDGQQQAQQNMQAALAEAAKNTVTNGKGQDTQSAANATTATAATAKAGGAEGMSNPQGVTQNHTLQQQQQTAATQKPQHNPQAQHRAQVTEQVNVQIQKAIAGGMDKINIQLKPAHLGRVDVSMEMSSDGRITAVVTADNKDTLNLLKQDSHQLEKAMREAGLDLNSGDLSFNLREGSGDEGDTQTANGNKGGLGPLTNEPPLNELLEASTARPNIITEDRVDITA